MTTFSDNFNRADGALPAPWVDWTGGASVPTTDAEVVGNQLVIHYGGSALIWVNPASSNPRLNTLQHLAFDFVSQSTPAPSADPYVAVLWSEPSGQAPFGALSRSSLYTVNSRYDLTGSPADVINPGDRVDVTYGATGNLTVRVSGVVKLDVNIFLLEAGMGDATEHWRVAQAGLSGDDSAATTVLDNFTVTYDRVTIDFSSRPSTTRAHFRTRRS